MHHEGLSQGIYLDPKMHSSWVINAWGLNRPKESGCLSHIWHWRTTVMSLFLINIMRSANNFRIECPLLKIARGHLFLSNNIILVFKYFCRAEGSFGKKSPWASFFIPNIFLVFNYFCRARHHWKKSTGRYSANFFDLF